MNPRSVINFFKTPAGAFLGFCIILGVIFFAAKRFLPGATQPPPLVFSTKTAAADASKQTLDTYQNINYSPVKNLPPTTSSVNQPRVGDSAGIQSIAQSSAENRGIAHQPVFRNVDGRTKAAEQKLCALWPIDSV
jgi:hypothetical protein